MTKDTNLVLKVEEYSLSLIHISGGLVLLVLNKIGLKASNVFFEIIYGGPELRPELSWSAVVLSFVVIVAVGAVSSAYPTALVMRTSPLKAMESSR